ncbi:MAG TPA: hypothetical protein PLW93_02795 [Candidatus Absconditabacterales bacterium]|nr:hypothetical protein [Candidatus Absconditabacterales bacterium]
MSTKSNGQTLITFGPTLNPAVTFDDAPKPQFSSTVMAVVTCLVQKRVVTQLMWGPTTESIIGFGGYYFNKGGSFGKQPIGIAAIIGLNYDNNTLFYGIGPDIAINGGKQWLTPMFSFSQGSKPSLRVNLIIPFHWVKELKK